MATNKDDPKVAADVWRILNADPKDMPSTRLLGKMFGMSKNTVQHMRAMSDETQPDGSRLVQVGMVRGNDGKLRPSRRFDTSERDAQIVGMREDDKSVRQIATALGCSVGTVHRVIHKRALGTAT